MATESKGALLPVGEALWRILAGVTPLEPETVAIEVAHGRVLAADIKSRLTQPPFAASAMDGYAVRAADAVAGAELTHIGKAAAGHPFAGAIGQGETVRIFTGAPLPEGADAVLIQEDAEQSGVLVTPRGSVAPGAFVRPRGMDFAGGEVRLAAGRRLTCRDVSLAAAMGFAELPLRRSPTVAILATGDELVAPGATPGPGQIVSSIPVGLAGLVRQAGGLANQLGIARDTLRSLDERLAMADRADIVLTIGGASVGDYDLVARALGARGLALDFWNIAMRPGKPLMYGRLGRQRVLGLPGNPVSAFLCARVFLVPLLSALLGEPAPAHAMQRLRLAGPIEANGPRQHYARARTVEVVGERRVLPLASQDSSLLATLALADVLIVQPPFAAAAEAGAEVDVLPLDF